MTSLTAMSESDIRSALHSKRLRHHKLHPDTLVINELGLAHARSRIDVAVINGHIHGYEIKSAQDNLGRLNKQLEIYQQALHKLTIVAASKHVMRIQSDVPDWCGIIEAKQGPRRGVLLKTVRPAKLNPSTTQVMVAHLLWRAEALKLLMELGYAPKELRFPRRRLYEMLCEALTPQEVTRGIRQSMACRQTWRDHQTPV